MGIFSGFVILGFNVVYNVAKLIALILVIKCCLKYLKEDTEDKGEIER